MAHAETMPYPSIYMHIFERAQIFDYLVEETAQLFSSEYGFWGPEAANKIGPFAKQGYRVKMSPARVRKECVPEDGDTILILARADFTELAGHAYATFWEHEGRRVGWITQLCVKAKYRKQGLATRMLRAIKQQEERCTSFGILSSHPAAIMATSRAFGHGIEQVDLAFIKDHAAAIMSNSPVNYVKTAALRGPLFRGNEGNSSEGSVCCAFTNFFVDHGEVNEAMANVRKRLAWPFGELPEGCEYLAQFETGAGHDSPHKHMLP
ncbi:hypothetical protein N0V90_001089 [Kalmusia sp. IMI 367209]|nr:hypothetical protein N0V90_001089 [Kalmusia sp. IMI 367209]